MWVGVFEPLNFRSHILIAYKRNGISSVHHLLCKNCWLPHLTEARDLLSTGYTTWEDKFYRQRSLRLLSGIEQFAVDKAVMCKTDGGNKQSTREKKKKKKVLYLLVYLSGPTHIDNSCHCCVCGLFILLSCNYSLTSSIW